jgi:CRISPR-associated protein Cmr6
MATYGVLTRLGTANAQDPEAAIRPYLRGSGSRGGPNAALVFTGMWVGKRDNGGLAADATGQLKHLNQVVKAASTVDPGMLAALHRRRRAAAEALAERSGLVVREIVIRPLWRVVVGHGGESNYETGLTFSRTYGVPAWPGSGLKGLAAAQAAAPDDTDTADEATMIRLFGSPRPHEPDQDAHQGGVVVLDALPAERPTLVVDVLTPHQTQYYAQVNTKGPVTTPPAEYHSPVPVRFLAVAATPFRTLLIGKPGHVREFRSYLQRGLDDRGLGGKTAAGYGYCTVEDAT